jgi:integrase
VATLYLRGKTWWAWGYDRNNERWRRSTNQTDERVAATVAAKIEQELALDANRPKDQTFTLKQALQLTIDHAEDIGRAEGTIEFLTSKARHLRRVMGSSKLCARLSLANTNAHVKARIAEGAHRHTVQKEIRVLLQALRYARKLGKYEGVDPSLLRPEGLENAYVPRERWLTPDQYQQLLWELHPGNDGRRHVDRRGYIVVACGTGLRLGELERIEAHHCNFASKLLQVPGTKTRKSRRVIPMTPAVEEELAARCEQRPVGPLFPTWHTVQRDLDAACLRIERKLNPGWEVPDEAPVNKRGVPHKKGRLRPPVRFDTVSPNDLRRTFASWLAQAGVPLFHAAELMGHEDTAMLQRVYAQLAPENARNAVAMLPASVTAALGKPASKPLPAELN